MVEYFPENSTLNLESICLALNLMSFVIELCDRALYWREYKMHAFLDDDR